MEFLIIVELATTLLFFLTVIIVLLFYNSMFWSLFRDAPFVPLPKHVAESMVELAEVKPGEKVIDLGSGHGEIIFAAVRKGAKAEGYELGRFLVFLTRLRKFLFYPKSDVKIYRKDLYGANLKDKDVVFCYLLTNTMNRLQYKFKNELKPGARIVAAGFQMSELKPIKILDNHKKSGLHKLYLYRIDK